MTKQMEETVAERRAYVDQIRASFYPEESRRTQAGKTAFWRSSSFSENQEQEGETKYSSLGIRTMIACLIFAVFVYCDQKQITFYQYKTQDVWKQIEWNPLPLEELKETIKISLEHV